jgi:hypothetical protein
MNYCTIDDINALFRQLSTSEEAKAEPLIEVVSARLREEARKVHRDLDEMISLNPDLAIVAKSVCVDVIARTLMTSTNQEPMTQFSQAAGGYSVSGSFLIPGGGIFIKQSELAALGLKRQRIGAINVFN